MQLSEINKELENIAPKLLSINKVMPYDVPDNYFDRLSIEALLYTNNKAVGYTVPDNYFESFAGNMLLKVGKPAEASAPSVPEGYFDNFADNLLAKLKSAEGENRSEVEEAELPAIFASISKEMPYHVPAGYFEADIKIPAKEDDAPKQGKVVSISNKRNWFKYAAAVVAIGLLVSIGVRTIDTPAGIENPVVATANATITDSNNTVENEFAVMLAQLDSKTLINDEDENDSNKANISEDLMSDDIESSLKKLSDKDLIAFLQTVGIN